MRSLMLVCCFFRVVTVSSLEHLNPGIRRRQTRVPLNGACVLVGLEHSPTHVCVGMCVGMIVYVHIFIFFKKRRMCCDSPA
jgi:hypothetical protein